MTQLAEPTPVQPAVQTGDDLVAAILQVLRQSDEPLTVSKVKTKLPMRFREMDLDEALRRQVSANVLYQFPRYRSQQDRFWDRPMDEHIRVLLRQLLAEGALAWSEIRRKMPAYALDRAEAIFQEEIGQGRLFRHPRIGRGGDRFGVKRPDPKDYLRSELTELFGRLEQLGFSQEQLRSGALELLHEEEWASLPANEIAPPPAPEPPAASAPSN